MNQLGEELCANLHPLGKETLAIREGSTELDKFDYLGFGGRLAYFWRLDAIF